MVLSDGMNPNCENLEQTARQRQKIGQPEEHTVHIPGDHRFLIKIKDKHDGCGHHRQQQGNGMNPMACGDIGVQEGEENQCDPEQPHNHTALNVGV